MKISTLLTGFMLAGLFAHAQQKTIEVTATDTVYLKATEFWYSIMVDDAADDMNDAFDTTSAYKNYNLRRARAAENKKRLEDSLSALLAGKGFVVLTPAFESSFALNYDNHGFGINILVHSVDSVQLLYNIIKNNPLVTAYINIRKASDETAARKRLVAKVLAAARAKAAVIADACKLTLGTITTVKEVENDGGWVAYPPLSALANVPGWHTTASKLNLASAKNAEVDYYAISATLTVTFTAQ